MTQQEEELPRDSPKIYPFFTFERNHQPLLQFRLWILHDFRESVFEEV